MANDGNGFLPFSFFCSLHSIALRWSIGSGPVKPHANSSVHSFLGCANEREKQLQQLHKQWESYNAKTLSGKMNVDEKNHETYGHLSRASNKQLHSSAFR